MTGIEARDEIAPPCMKISPEDIHEEITSLRTSLRYINEAVIAALNRLDVLETTYFPKQRRPIAPWKQPFYLPQRGAEGVAQIINGATLRARREALEISQAAEAAAAHCSRGLVAEVERGKRRNPQTLAHLDATLGRLEAASK